MGMDTKTIVVGGLSIARALQLLLFGIFTTQLFSVYLVENFVSILLAIAVPLVWYHLERPSRIGGIVAILFTIELYFFYERTNALRAVVSRGVGEGLLGDTSTRIWSGPVLNAGVPAIFYWSAILSCLIWLIAGERSIKVDSHRL